MTARGILIVDDEPILQMIASEVAAEAGYDPICAATGAEALRILDEHAADLAAVVTDIEMPGDLDGLALAARIRDRWPDVNVVVASGSPFEVPAGCRALTKPYRAAEFESAIASVSV